LTKGQLLGLVAVGGFTFAASFRTLLAFRAALGLRVAAEAESDGPDLAEHGVPGYPELVLVSAPKAA
jgi:ammonium transporter, Amt family